MKKILSILFTAMMLFAMNTNAAFLTFTDRASWESAIGGSSGTEDLNSFTTDTSTSGGVSLSNGISVAGNWIIDADPFSNDFECDLNGSTRLCGNNNSQITFGFAGGISAFGADFSSLNDNGLRTSFSLFDGATLLATLTPPQISGQTDRFWGFAATGGETVTSMTSVKHIGDTFGIDNLSVKKSVPAPASLLLLGLGLLSLSRRPNAAG